MKRKGDPDRYSFGECCLFVLMVMGTGLSIFGMLAACVVALATHSFSPLIWLILCCVVAVVCCAGLMYVLGGEGYGNDDFY
jgi:hypothetical protein